MQTSRWIKVVLFVSLALNLLVAGLFVGRVVSGDKRSFRAPPELVAGSGPLMGALPPEARRVIIDDLRGRIDDQRQGRESRRAALDRLVALIVAEPLDRAAIEAEFAGHRARTLQIAGLGEAALLDWLEAQDAETRAAFAERITERLRERRER